jgi:hypothetical protein
MFIYPIQQEKVVLLRSKFSRDLPNPTKKPIIGIFALFIYNSDRELTIDVDTSTIEFESFLLQLQTSYSTLPLQQYGNSFPFI